MRSMFSSSYSALNNGGSENGVYRATTRPSFSAGETREEPKNSVLTSVRRIFGGGGSLRNSHSVFVLPHSHEGNPSPNVSFLPNASKGGVRRDRRSTMPTSASMEEAALLGCNPSESMEEVELKNIQLSFPSARTLSRGESLALEERVQTAHGTILVAIQGDRAKPAILTYHDLGLNYVSNFQAFFNFVDMRLLLQNFCIFHVNAPGQEEGAATLPENFVYPTMDELGDQIGEIIAHFGLKRFIGLGVGAGANILCRYALSCPDKVDALCVLNCVSTQAGWIEWGYQKINLRYLKSKGMTQGTLDYLMWHHFGKVTEERNHDLVYVYRQYFETQVNPMNLGLFIDSYIRRTDLAIARELDEIKKKDVRTLRMSVLNITGGLSPHIDDTVTFNGRLDPTNSTWMKLQDCGNVLEEQPAKLSEAFRLFLQGQGYALKLFRKNSLPEVPCLSVKKVNAHRKMSVDSGAGSSAGSSGSLNGGKVEIGASGSGSSGISTPRETSAPLISLNSPTELSKAIADIRITENPISESPELKAKENKNPVC